VAYTPVWEPLAEALKRVKATGLEEDEAKADLCNAMADGKINVRVRIAAKDTLRGKFFTGSNIRVPPHLVPADFDWTHSQPVNPWQIGPALGQHYTWIEDWKNRPLDLIKLSTADVIEVLCHREKQGRVSAKVRHENDAIEALARYLKSNPELTKTEAMAFFKASGFNVRVRGFQSRVWPKAREQAGLGALAPSGRKKKIDTEIALKSLHLPQRFPATFQKLCIIALFCRSKSSR
jgi:hypothetical protein